MGAGPRSRARRVRRVRDAVLGRAGLAVGLVVVLASLPPASAQLMLPGAFHGPRSDPAPHAPGGAGESGSAAAAPGNAKPARLPPASEATLVGRELSRDGSKGAMAFGTTAAKGLEISSLSLAGEEIARPGAPCRVDVVAGTPIEARFTGRPGGLSRYEVAIAACPFAFEVLDGAVLVARDPKSCAFAAAGCVVDPTGLWGPRGDPIDARQLEQWERARARAEASMRANFRALLASAGKDREAVKRIAGEQAGFSSERSVACATYAGEDVHGFCALRLTEARAIALQARRDAAGKPRTDQAPGRGATRKTTAP